jgi:hypothetical protein
MRNFTSQNFQVVKIRSIYISIEFLCKNYISTCTAPRNRSALFPSTVYRPGLKHHRGLSTRH